MTAIIKYNFKTVKDIHGEDKVEDDISDLVALLSFPIVESSVNKSSIEITAYKSTFSGPNELIGYAKLEFLTGSFDSTGKQSGMTVANHNSLKLGFLFQSDYDTFCVSDNFYFLGDDRAVVIDYNSLLLRLKIMLSNALTIGNSHQTLKLSEIKELLKNLKTN